MNNAVLPQRTFYILPLPLPIDRCDPPPPKKKPKKQNKKTMKQKKTKTEIQTPNGGHNYLTKQTPYQPHL